MITYEKLVIITGDRYVIRTDQLEDLPMIFSEPVDVNTRMILILKNGDDTFPIDLDRLVMNHAELLTSENVRRLIEQLTPELIYSFREQMFSEPKYIRSFMSHDLPGAVTISPCNLITGELSDVTYDANYGDMVILCDGYDLTNAIPVIDNKLRNCSWSDAKIFLAERVNLAKDVDVVTFLSFGNMKVTLKSLSEVAIDNWEILPNTTVIVVLNGALFYASPSTYKVKRNKLILNEQFIMNQFTKYGFESFDDIITDLDSFVIMIEAERILIRDVSMLQQLADSREFVYYESRSHDHPIDYVCLDNVDNSVHGISMFYPKFKNVVTNTKDNENHIYADSGSSDMRLIQLSVF